MAIFKLLSSNQPFLPLPLLPSFRSPPPGTFSSSAPNALLRYVLGTYLVLDIVVHGRDAVVFGRPRVKQAKTLHCHRVNRVSDSLVKIPRQIVRDVELAAPRFSRS